MRGQAAALADLQPGLQAELQVTSSNSTSSLAPGMAARELTALPNCGDPERLLVDGLCTCRRQKGWPSARRGCMPLTVCTTGPQHLLSGRLAFAVQVDALTASCRNLMAAALLSRAPAAASFETVLPRQQD